eukprot:TRINITY_DN8376_c0_g1_i1.p1 TRINITY_DN8376_c0_g1~~TRINITY_DN8376_c0_g1_i1.p1  ORF type:complete len:477 (+),score=182.71 TRINITY_DN8376_c0_g1_i1:54-1484(+)
MPTSAPGGHLSDLLSGDVAPTPFLPQSTFATPQASYGGGARGVARRFASHRSPFQEVAAADASVGAMMLGAGEARYLPSAPGDGSVGAPMEAQPSTSEYLANFYREVLVETEEDAEDVILRLRHQELEIRKRMYSLANADMFRVRFLEEARWELRERHEVIARLERLERSRYETELITAVRALMVRGGGSWCEDARREAVVAAEDKAWRQIDHAHRRALQEADDEQWGHTLRAEYAWRRQVEDDMRCMASVIQLDEHRHRSYLETELYPSNLNKLLHTMELEWVRLLEGQTGAFKKLVESRLASVGTEEEDARADIRAGHKRAVREFHTLHQLLELQHHEEYARSLVVETSDRLFSIIYNRERVQGKALVDRAKLLAEDVQDNAALSDDPRTVKRDLQIKELELCRKTCEVDRQMSEAFLKDQQLRQRLAEMKKKEHLLATKLHELKQTASTSTLPSPALQQTASISTLPSAAPLL